MLYPRLVNSTLATSTSNGAARIEIVRLRREGEYYDAQLAVDGVLSPAMEVHASVREAYPREEDFLSYLARSAETMIRIYGDARHPLPLLSPEENEMRAMAAAP